MARVLFVLPEWPGTRGLGGSHAFARSLHTALASNPTNAKISYLLGKTEKELNDYDRAEIKRLQTDLIEPDISYDEVYQTGISERIVNYKDYYDDQLDTSQYTHIVAFSHETHRLALYYIEQKQTKCQLVMFNLADPKSSEETIAMADCARSSAAVVSVGGKLYRKLQTDFQGVASDLLEKHFKCIPDFTGVLPESSSVQPSQKELRILVPLTEKDSCAGGMSFANMCVCSVQDINKMLIDLGEPQRRAELIIQVNDTQCCYDKVLPSSTQCTVCNKQHQKYIDLSCENHSDMTRIASTVSIVLASGEFQDSGYSGLEFLANGVPTFVPKGSDVAEILQEISPTTAQAFILESLTDEDPHIVKGKWVKHLMLNMKSPDKLVSATKKLAAELRNSTLLIQSSQRLLDMFVVPSTETTGPLSRNSYKEKLFTIPSNELLIGTGRYSCVYTTPDGKQALKIINMANVSMNKEVLMREVKIMTKLENVHKHIIKLFNWHFDETRLYIVMELAEKSMHQAMATDEYKQLSKETKMLVLKQLYDGLQYLHMRLIVHQDMKPSNIMFTDGWLVKLADFGTGRIKTRLQDESTENQGAHAAGTPYYQAPEMQIYGRAAQPHSDVWSAGAVAVEWMTGKKPWLKTLTFFYCKQTKILPHMLTHVKPKALQPILRDALSYNRKERPSAKMVRDKIDVLLNPVLVVKTGIYDADEANELSLKPGDRVKILENHTGGSDWSTGEVNGNVGLFQMNSVVFQKLGKNEPLTPKKKKVPTATLR